MLKNVKSTNHKGLKGLKQSSQRTYLLCFAFVPVVPSLCPLKWKLNRCLYLRLHIFRFFRSDMNRIAIDENCFIWSGGACKFTMPATNTDIFSNFRNNKISFIRYHMAGLCWTSFGAGSTGCFFCLYYTVIFYKFCLS